MMARAVLPAILVLLGAAWGMTHPLSKLAVMTGHGPWGLIFWQLVLCTALFGAICLWRGRVPLLTAPALRFYVVIALIGTLIPNFTFYSAVVHLPAGIMSIIISTVPMLAFAMALGMGTERLAPLRLTGLALGALGVALIAQPGGSLPAGAWPWLLLAMIGPLCYAAEANYVGRVGMAGMDPVQALLGASIVGVVMCLPVTLATGQFIAPWRTGLGPAEAALVGSALLHGAAYAGYVWLAARAGSVFAAQCSYLVTALGVVFAMMILGERLPPTAWAALVVMLCGMAMVQPRTATA